MAEPQQDTDASRRDPETGWIVFGAICFTGLGVVIAVPTSGR